MKSWFAVLFVAIAGKLALADLNTDVDFVENVKGYSRIVSGWEAIKGQHPHQVSLRMVNLIGRVNGCGGSIISDRWILTAAHCTATRYTFVVRIGAVHMTRPEYIVEAWEYYNHPQYNNALPAVVQPHDIGLLKLPIILTFSANVQPIRLQPSAHQGKNYAGLKLVASGWGLTWTGGSAAQHMNWVYLVGVSYQSCRAAYGYSSIIAPSTICAGAYNVTSQSTCSGDSGGPLTLIEDDGVRTLIGVTSFVSATGCHTNYPAGFIQPGYYHPWILDVTGINFDWDWQSGSNESSGTDESDSDSSSSSFSSSSSSSEED